MNRLKPWTLHQLQEMLREDLAACQTANERSCALAIGGAEIREKARLWAQSRKLTPGEVAIASQYGYRP